jgi:cytochrome b6-f complex iron-sulfur subunit
LPDEHEKAPGEPSEEGRRDFLAQVGIGACALAVVGSGIVTLDFLRPKVLFEPPTIFPVADPAEITEGTVRFNRQYRAYVIGAQDGIYALSAVCTHLGCITRYLQDEEIIACPCHGSRFDLEGNVIHGPAPRPLPWLEVKTDPEGLVVVDTSIVVPHGKVTKA